MPGLLLNLKPYEKFIVGGSVLQNGPRRTQLRIVDGEPGVLRMEDALHPDDVKTPLTRAYYAAQLLLTKSIPVEQGHEELTTLLQQAESGFQRFDMLDDIVRASKAAAGGQYYKVLKTLKPLLPKEAGLFAAIDIRARALTLSQGVVK